MKGKKFSKEICKRMSDAHIGKPLSEKQKAALKKSSKAAWARKTKRERDEWRKAIAKGLNLKPNKPERLFLKLLNKLYPNEWKFTGDFSFILNGKSPDFTNCNGQKKLIELYGDYWHRNDDPQDRIDEFAQFGYKTLVIWENELKNIDRVIKRVNKFMVI